MTLDTLLPQFLALGGVATLATAIINALKQFGIVKDGQAPTASLLLNAAGFVALILLKVFSPDFDFASADATAASLSQILVLVLGLVGQLLVSKAAHTALKGTPVIGKSFSGK